MAYFFIVVLSFKAKKLLDYSINFLHYNQRVFIFTNYLLSPSSHNLHLASTSLKLNLFFFLNFLLILSDIESNTKYIRGITTNVSKVDVVRPPAINKPIPLNISLLSPLENIKGICPNIVVIAVINIGLNLVGLAFNTASTALYRPYL